MQISSLICIFDLYFLNSLIPIKKLTEIIAKPSNHSDSSLGILEIQDLETYSDDNEDLDKSRG